VHRHQIVKRVLRNHAVTVASADLCVVRTISFKLIHGLVILSHERRRPVRINLHGRVAGDGGRGPDALRLP
jgi:hypothetical protein